MCPEDEPQSQPACSSSPKPGVTLTCEDLDGAHEASQTIEPCADINRTTQVDIHCLCNAGVNKKHFGSFVKRLMDAEAALVSAAVQLASLKDILRDPQSSAVNKQRVVTQRGLLLQKMEDFRQINQLVRQRLSQLLDEETARIDASTKIGALLNKILQIERENQLLKGDLGVTEKRAEELMCLQQKEQENIKSALNIAKCAEGTRARIQGQLRNKEAENNRLTVQVRTLERSMTRHKAEIEELKTSLAALTERSWKEKEVLKKALRVHKQKAKRSETALNKCLSQLQDKDTQLSTLQEKKEMWKREKEQLTEENHKLTAHVEILQKQRNNIPGKLQDMEMQTEMVKEKEWEERMREKEKEAIKEMEDRAKEREQRLAKCEAALAQERSASTGKDQMVEQFRNQVAALEAELSDIKRQHRNLSQDLQRVQDGEDSKANEVRQELQGHVEELQHLPEMLRESELKLLACQEELQTSEQKCSKQSETIEKLQKEVVALESELSNMKLQHKNVSQDLQKAQDGKDSKADELQTQVHQVQSAVQLRESAENTRSKLQDQVDTLQKALKQLRQEKQELEGKLEVQKQVFHNNSQLLEHRSASFAELQSQQERRSSDYESLNRQLTQCSADLLFFKEQVKHYKEQVTSKDETLQITVNKLGLLRQSKLATEKRLEAQVKELQLSLEKCESHKKNMQNYVDFLKNSYLMIFDDQISTFWSSTFMK